MQVLTPERGLIENRSFLGLAPQRDCTLAGARILKHVQDFEYVYYPFSATFERSMSS